MELINANVNNPSCKAFGKPEELVKYLLTADVENDCKEMKLHVNTGLGKGAA